MVTFPANDRIIQIIATGGQTIFNIDFPVLDEQDIVVVQEGTTLILTTNYTVQGVGNQSGATITLVVGATLNDVVTIIGSQPVERLTDFTTGGAFNGVTINLELDKLTQQNQEQARDIDGTLRTDFDDAQRTLNPIPDKAARLDKVLGFDPTTGQPVVSTVNLSAINAFIPGVESFEGRTGVVVAASGDYTASEITNVAAGGIAAIDIQAAINELDTEKAAALHASNHTDGTDDIQDATASVKGLATAAQITKLDGIETAATADQSDAEIKTAYENNADTNEFSDAEQTKLAGIATGAEVNPDLISQAEAEAGTATTERIFSALRVAQAIAALETGGGGGEANTAANVGAGVGWFRDKTGVTINLRTAVSLSSGLTIVLSGDEIDFDIVEGSIDHDALLNFDVNEHFLQSAITEVGTVTVGNVDAVVSAASESLAGKIELATQAEADTGTDDTRAITPLKLDERLKGFRAVNAQTGTSYTAVAGDAGKLITMDNASANILTINDSVFSTDDVIHVVQKGAGATTIAGSASNNIKSGKSLVLDGQWSSVVIQILVGGASTISVVTGELV